MLDVEDSFVVAWEVAGLEKRGSPPGGGCTCVEVALCMRMEPQSTTAGVKFGSLLGQTWRQSWSCVKTPCIVEKLSALTCTHAHTSTQEVDCPLPPQCPRSTGSWSPFCAPSWSPGPPSRSWSREESSGSGFSAATWENTCSTLDTMVSHSQALHLCSFSTSGQNLGCAVDSEPYKCLSTVLCGFTFFYTLKKERKTSWNTQVSISSLK